VTITFETDYQYELIMMAFVFVANVDGKRIECRMSEESLSDQFRVSHSNIEQGFEQYRVQINGIAEAMIRQGLADDEGPLLITNANITPFLLSVQ